MSYRHEGNAEGWVIDDRANIFGITAELMLDQMDFGDTLLVLNHHLVAFGLHFLEFFFTCVIKKSKTS